MRRATCSTTPRRSGTTPSTGARCARPAAGHPRRHVRALVVSSFGSLADFKLRFAEAANGRFGSGWAWLVTDARGRLRIQSTRERREPPAARLRTAAHARRVGARLLPRLPERARALRARLPRPSAELGVRRREPACCASSTKSRLPFVIDDTSRARARPESACRPWHASCFVVIPEGRRCSATRRSFPVR